MKKWQITILVTVIIFIFGLAGAGWSQRPIIDYYLDDVLDEVDFKYQILRVSLKYQNRGNIDASLNLVITVTNANITVDKLEPWIEYNETKVKFHVAAKSHMETYSDHKVNISPVGDAQNFAITYTIEDTTGGLINGIISHLFLESHGYFPTYALYNKTDTNTYTWLK